MKLRSRVHMLEVAAARLENDHANPKLIADLRAAAKIESKRISDGRSHDEQEEKRIERQRTAFTMLPDVSATDHLKRLMMQRVYDLMWNGDCSGADAIAEFLPSVDATKAFDAWEHDWSDRTDKTEFYRAA